MDSVGFLFYKYFQNKTNTSFIRQRLQHICDLYYPYIAYGYDKQDDLLRDRNGDKLWPQLCHFDRPENQAQMFSTVGKEHHITRRTLNDKKIKLVFTTAFVWCKSRAGTDTSSWEAPSVIRRRTSLTSGRLPSLRSCCRV